MWAAVAVLVVVPLAVLATSPGGAGSGWRLASLASGLAAASLLLVTLVLPSRLRTITTYLGVERVLRSHRALALVATGLVLAHVGSVLAHTGVGVLDLREAPPRVWAASVATLALVVLVPLAATRQRRRPRYEGWRLAHLVLANTVLAGTPASPS